MKSLDKILNTYQNEISPKSTSKKRIYIIKHKDKLSAQKDIENDLKKNKINFYRKKDNSLSGSTEITVISDTLPEIFLVFKPASGGMSETTLNSTITELSPALAFSENFKPKDIDSFYQFLKNIDHKKSSVYVIDRDRVAGEKFINEFPSSSKFKEKMENAMGVLKYLYEENKKNKIKKVYWGYREKPKGIDSKHKGDLFLEYFNDKMVGVSLKAGSEGSKEPKLNTYVNPILQNLNLKKVDELRLELWNKTYKNFTKDRFNYDKKSEEKKVLIQKLSSLEKNDENMYNELYDKNLDIIRNYLTESFQNNVKKTVSYLSSAIVGKDDVVPLIVIKAYGKDYKILTDEDDVGIFLPKVKKIKSYPSKTSKQDFYVELISSPTDMLKMKFSVRTNKTGDEHKLGQFYNLAVKFSGIV